MADQSLVPTEQDRQRADAAAKEHTEAVKKHAEETRKRLSEQRSEREKASKEHARMASEIKPTPTQEECDLAAEGVYLEEHEPDGSPSDVPGTPEDKRTKQIEGKPARAGYTTGSTTPA